MEVQIVGYGGAFDTQYVNSSLWVNLNGTRYLVDCGHSVFPELVKRGLADKVDVILITHLHDDHVGSLSSYLLYRHHALGIKAPEIWCPNQAFYDQLTGFLSYSQRDLSMRVQIKLFPQQDSVGFMDSFGLHVPGMITFAFYFREEGQSLVWSGDLGQGDFIFDELKRLNLPNPVVLHEMSYQKVHTGHTSFKHLEQYASQYKIFGYHCRPEDAPENCIIPHIADHLTDFL